MVGNIILWIAIGGGVLFLSVLAFVVIEEGVRDRRAAAKARTGGDRAASHDAATAPIHKLAA